MRERWDGDILDPRLPDMAGWRGPRRVRRSRQSGRGLLTLFLDLFLFLLVFFIMLFSISHIDGGRHESVIESIEGRFGIELPEFEDQTAFSGRQGNVLAPPAFEESVRRMFTDVLAVEEVEVARAGDRLEVRMPATALHRPERAVIRDNVRDRLLPRLADALGRRPEGVRYVAHSFYGRPGGAAASDLTLQRAATLGQALRALDAPADGVAAGFDPAVGADRLVIRFFALGADGGTVSLDAVTLPGPAPDPSEGLVPRSPGGGAAPVDG